MRSRRRPRPIDSTEENFWPSFADLTSTFVMILFVLVLLAYIQNIISGKHLAVAQAALGNSAAMLHKSQEDVTRSQDRLRVLQLQLQQTSAEITVSKSQVQLASERIAQQEVLLAQSREDLANLKTKLAGVAVLRVELLERVKAALETELAGKLPSKKSLVSIADNGNIVIHENLVFEYNSYDLKEEGKAMLAMLASGFARVLADDPTRANIDAIMIQGHTDSRGSMAFNRELSAKRANAVLDYMFEVVPELETRYPGFFTSAAFSKARPLTAGRNEAEHEKNRRIEISVVLRDQETRRMIEDYIKQAATAVEQPNPPTTIH